MPFYQFGEVIFLKLMSTQQWTDYIISHFSHYNRSITKLQAEWICKAVENHSAYVQQLAWLVFTQTETGEKVKDDMLSDALERLLETNEQLFMQQIEPLSTYQMNFLRAVTNGVHTSFGDIAIREEYNLGSYSNIERLKSALLERDLIDLDGKNIFLTDPIFTIWLKKRIFI